MGVVHLRLVFDLFNIPHFKDRPKVERTEIFVNNKNHNVAVKNIINVLVKSIQDPQNRAVLILLNVKNVIVVDKVDRDFEVDLNGGVKKVGRFVIENQNNEKVDEI